MKHLLLLGCWLLAQAAAQAQAASEPSAAQLRRALRQHPQADRRRVDLLNELADGRLRMIDGIPNKELNASQVDSLTRLSYALARRLQYQHGEAYAGFLNTALIEPARLKSGSRSDELHWLKQAFIPLLARIGDNRLLSGMLIKLIFSDKLAKDNPRYLQRAITAAQATHSPRLLCHAYRAQGHYYRVVAGDYYQSLQSYFRELRTAQQASLPDEAADALTGLGDMYVNMGDYEPGLRYYRQGIAYAAQVAPAGYRAVVRQNLLTGLGYGYSCAGNYPQALATLRQGAQLGAPTDGQVIYIESLIAQALDRQHNPAALAYTRRQLRKAHRYKATRCYSLLLRTLAHYYLRSGQADSAAANGRRALRFSHDMLYKEDEVDVLRVITQAYALGGHYAQAYAYQSRYLGLHDTLSNEQAVRRITALRFDQDMARQRAEITQLTTTQQLQAAAVQRQRWLLLAALVVLLLLASLAATFWRNSRQKQRANALLAAQKAQIEEQAARLGELDEAKNQFFANASHELRTPLTLVLGPLDTLLTDPAQALPAAARGPVELAHRQAQRLGQLVNRILDLTKLQAGRLVLHPTPTPLASFLRRVVVQFESLAAQRGIALSGPPPLPDDLRLLLDADKVEEILTNLLINALNHTPAGGAVLVQVALAGPGQDRYAVTVRDTGPGIAPAEQARVFERFYQSPQGQAQGGTGLGLALSRELALLLGGTLTLASEPGQGAAFTLAFRAERLPAVAEPAPTTAAMDGDSPAAAPLPPIAPGSGNRARILVVEDQPDLREYLRELLAPDHEVLTAADGQAALDLLATEDPVDLVTTDAMMPHLSGTELLARLRADPARAGVPVLMLTARTDETHRLAALTVGVDDYLTKPFATTELLARVRTLLARHEVRRQFAALPAEEPEPETPPTPPASAASVAPQPLARPAPAATPARRRPATAPAAAQLAQWQALLAPHLANEGFGPAELASLLCLSERTLYRRLGELAGLTPAAWLRELRLTQARYLLEAGDFDSVAAVADAVGFASPKYFAALYAERFGRRPADYHA